MQTVASHDEESPSFKRTGCWLTASEGDFKDSATEINRPRVREQGWKGSVRDYRLVGDN